MITPSVPRPSRIAHLEDLAKSSLGNRRLRTAEEDAVYCYTEKLGLDLQETTARLNLRFPEKPLVALDVGGARGEFALQLQAAGYRAFCLDPRPGGKVAGLAARSVIIGKAEAMNGIPDESIHLVTSIRALGSGETDNALRQIYRILHRGGEAFLDLHLCDFRACSSLLLALPSAIVERTAAPSCLRVIKDSSNDGPVLRR